MPYGPSEKTDGKSQDRNILDEAVEMLSLDIVEMVESNGDVRYLYDSFFYDIAYYCISKELPKTHQNDIAINFAKTVLEVGASYKYEGAFLGELNYSITRVIQRVPQLLAEKGKCGLSKGKELRYWLYAMTVDALIGVANRLLACGYNTKGIAGVFEDIKDEYKVRVNKSYEIAQILKSGDCYDTPYFNKVVEIINKDGKVVGHTYIELTNDGENYKLDKMPFRIIAE
jgi:hypothetical protein